MRRFTSIRLIGYLALTRLWLPGRCASHDLHPALRLCFIVRIATLFRSLGSLGDTSGSLLAWRTTLQCDLVSHWVHSYDGRRSRKIVRLRPVSYSTPYETRVVYLVAIMDWFSRYVLDWQISTTLGADFCIEAFAASHGSE